MPHSHYSSLLPPADHERAIQSPELAVRFDRAVGHFAKQRLQVYVPIGRAAGLFFPEKSQTGLDGHAVLRQRMEQVYQLEPARGPGHVLAQVDTQ